MLAALVGIPRAADDAAALTFAVAFMAAAGMALWVVLLARLWARLRRGAGG